jgi:hypothetical protein
MPSRASHGARRDSRQPTADQDRYQSDRAAVGLHPRPVQLRAGQHRAGGRQEFTLFNSGEAATGPLTVMVMVSGSAAFTVTSDGCIGTSLGPGQRGLVTVRFAPPSAGPATTTMMAASQEPAAATDGAQRHRSGFRLARPHQVAASRACQAGPRQCGLSRAFGGRGANSFSAWPTPRMGRACHVEQPYLDQHGGVIPLMSSWLRLPSRRPGTTQTG